MSTNTSLQNQAFALSMFANAVQYMTGPDLGPSAYEQINNALSNSSSGIGNWKIVWGPAVLSQPGDSAYSVNVMYVVQSQDDLSQYVIAIAGTNFKAVLDSVIEDCVVSLQVPWIYNSDAQKRGAQIAFGTSLGLCNLQNITPDAKLPGAGQKLRDFLGALDLVSGVLGQKVKITVAGHSLGGALASVLALWLADTQSVWDPGANATVAAYTFAGPTAGNGAFASYAGEKLGARLTPYYNTLDAIPHAWQEGSTPPADSDPPSLSALPGIYLSNIPPDLSSGLVLLLIGVFKFLAADGAYATLPNLQKITGTFDTKTDGKAKPDSFDRYVAQVGSQHISGYFSTFKYDPSWMPGMPQAPVCLSSTLTAILQKSSSPSEVVQALQNQKPQQIQVGGAVVDAPRGPRGPQTDRVVSLVQTELAKQGGQSSTT